ncbi:hypothetical protein [Nonomuraea guangzhouensis]|uniref:Neutral/alkaline non-lysosomal ceramidase N-terminal domain-containing protein n=1 Tax=Nonomuraea guangzhouensis TaxID=1291555 RepID=A0ABW4GGC7_9ACTN|nr:hypothetical protein [Nonomuraea guangzhouensis]
MRVGHGSANLPVPDGTPMGGYLDRPGPSAGLLDPLSVNAITWFDGERRFALAIADVICVNEDLAHRVRSDARSLGCELWLAASHTHSGPETGCVPGGGPTPAPWLDRLTEAVAAAIQQAIECERPCDGEAHHGELHGVGADRSRPSAPAVVPLTVIAVRHSADEEGQLTDRNAANEDGQLAGVLVVLPVHPTVLPAASRLVSADLVGAVRRALSARLGPDVWTLVATGAAGDISTRHTRRGQDAAELDRLAAIVADRCLELLREPPTRAWSADSEITWAARRLELAPVRLDESRDSVPVDRAMDPAALAADLRAAEASGDPVAVRLARSRLEGVQARPDRSGREGPIGVRVHAARLGELSVVGLPGEPFLAVAESIVPGGPVMVLGYVNGYPGYLPTAEAYERAEYEVLVSQVAPGSAEALAGVARQLLEDM